MLFRAVAALGLLATTVIADGAAISAAFKTIDKDTAALNTSVVKFNGDLISALPIVPAATTLLQDLDKGTKTAEDSDPLTVDEAVKIAGDVQGLSGDVTITVDNLIAAKPKFDKANLTGITLLILKSTKKSAQDFSDAVIEKVPESLQDTARGIAGGITTKFDEAIAAFSAKSSSSGH